MLVVRPESLEMSSHNIFGEVWLDLNGTHFPEQGWTDVVIPIVLQFLDALHATESEAQAQTVHFLDGPYEVHLKAFGSEDLQIEAYRRDKEDVLHLVVTSRTPRDGLARSVRRAASNVIMFSQENDYHSHDLERLENAL